MGLAEHFRRHRLDAELAAEVLGRKRVDGLINALVRAQLAALADWAFLLRHERRPKAILRAALRAPIEELAGHLGFWAGSR